MAFKNFPEQEPAVTLLQRSLARGRLAHAYLFVGPHTAPLEQLARTLAKTLNCQHPIRAQTGQSLDCCDACPSCRKIDHDGHPDVFWVRPESVSRVIKIEQIVPRENSNERPLTDLIYRKPTEAQYKVGVIVEADRLNVQAANAFLKTLEEPPPQSVLVLLTTDPQRIQETISSRCLRLNLGTAAAAAGAEETAWLEQFAAVAAADQPGLMNRYRLIGVLMAKLAEIRAEVESRLQAESPLAKFEEAEAELREKWEAELAAAIEAEYRRRRTDLIGLVQLWCREVWLQTLGAAPARSARLAPDATAQVAARLTVPKATENLATLERLQRLLNTNAQEALALEVSLLKLHL